MAGNARIARDGPSIPASPGQEVRRGDRIETSDNARMAVRFDDGTRVAIGERTSLTVSQFIADQSRRAGALLLSLASGIMRLSAAPPSSRQKKRVEVTTTAARIEGSTYDAVMSLGGKGLTLLLLDGRAEVRNVAGSVEVDKPRRGVVVSEPQQPPSRASGWHRDRIKEVLADVEGR